MIASAYLVRDYDMRGKYMSVGSPEQELLRLTTGIVAAHVSCNRLPAKDLPEFIHSIYAALSDVGTPAPPAEAQPEPAVPMKRSVSPDRIVCLEDGRKLDILKRHLRTRYGLNPGNTGKAGDCRTATR